MGLAEALGFLLKEIDEFIRDVLGSVWKMCKQYEADRIEYDACRNSYEALKSTQSPKLPGVEAKFLVAYNKMNDARC